MKRNSYANKFGCLQVVLILLRLGCINGSYFFHEPSYIELQSADTKKDFGFSLAYQSKLKSLAVGAPHSDLNGKVFRCPMGEVTKSKKLTCSDIDINIDTLAGNYSRHNSTDQNFCLGASISVTPDYIFTCAPLWSSNIIDGKTLKFGTLGTCFVTNGTHTNRYNGLLEQFVEKTVKKIPKIGDIYGGIGWHTVYDQINDLILIAKPSLKSSISVLQMNDPLQPTSPVLLGDKFIQYYNLGQNFAVGVFFNNHKVLYAFSMTLQSRLTGAIAFLYYEGSHKTMRILEDGRQPVLIEDTFTNSMYGTSLHSVDLNGDSFSELLVGAPAQTNDVGVHEHGAVLFYLGGGRPTTKTSSNLCVCGIKDGSRFGTAIASVDIDGDSVSEIFISAPYEESGEGAVYILAGYEIKKMLNSRSNSLIKVSELFDTQRIKHVPYKSFGFSVLPVRDFDENGGNVLAIGSPSNGTVVLYRSIPFINVTVTASRVGKESVKEDDMNFTVTVSVNVSFPVKPSVITGKLIVSTNIIGDPARIVNGNYEIKITKKQILYTNEVLVLLDNTDPGNYKFSAKVETDIDNLKKPDFDRSLFRIPNYSDTETVIDIARRCKEIVCVPRLSMSIQSSDSSDIYILGSRLFENMNLVVRNDGNTTFESCAWIKITGAKAAILGCIQMNEEWYKCDLINIERHEERSTNIRVDMSKATNRDNALEILVLLYNTCSASRENATVQYLKRIPFNLSTKDISIDYLYYDRNVTDREIEDVDSSPIISVLEFFKITNNGSVTWNYIHASVTFEIRPFIKNYSIIAPEKSECIEGTMENLIIFNCTLNLEANSTFKISATTNILKEKMMKYFDDGKLSVTSTYNLYLEPTSTVLNKTLTSTLYFQVDARFGNNKYIIIVVAVVVAVLVLAVVIFILYKVGFFERKEKAKLEEEKEKRQISVRRPHPDDEATCSQEDNQAEIEIMEDAIALQLRNYEETNDSASLIKT